MQARVWAMRTKQGQVSLDVRWRCRPDYQPRATKNEDADYGCAVVETPHRADSESILSLGSFAVHFIGLY